MPVTRSPNADTSVTLHPVLPLRRRRLRPLGRILPRTFQARLTLGFVSVVVLTLFLVSALVIKSLDDYFFNQEQVDLIARATTVRDFVAAVGNGYSGGRPVVMTNHQSSQGLGGVLDHLWQWLATAGRRVKEIQDTELGRVRNE